MTKQTKPKPKAPELDPKKVFDNTIYNNGNTRIIQYKDDPKAKRISLAGQLYDIVDTKPANNYRMGPCYRLELVPAKEE